MAKILVHRKAYHRKGFVAHRGGSSYRVSAAHVPATSYKTTDVGRRGRTPVSRRVIPKLKRGSLGGPGFFGHTVRSRHIRETHLARMFGEKVVASKLRAVGVLTKRTSPSTSHKAFADARYISGSYVGKKYVGYPKGFRRRR